MYLLTIRMTTSMSVSWNNAPDIWVTQVLQKSIVLSHSQKNRYDLFRPQTSRNDLVLTVTIQELLLHLLLEPLCYHSQFLLKHQPPIHILHSMHQLLSHGPKDISVRFNNLFADSAKLRSKEPKYNRSQPNHPNPQSVLRTPTRQS